MSENEIVIPRAPRGLDTRGRRLWRSLHESLGELVTEVVRESILEACRTADRLDRLDEICRATEPIMESRKGDLMANPAFAEARQQSNLFKQLIAVLRVPEASGRRPQQRTAARGSTAPHGAGMHNAKVTSLEDRLRSLKAV